MSIDLDFLECKICSVKPGSAQLCPSCIRNRYIISRLQQQVQELLSRNCSNCIYWKTEIGRTTFGFCHSEEFNILISGNSKFPTLPLRDSFGCNFFMRRKGK